MHAIPNYLYMVALLVLLVKLPSRKYRAEIIRRVPIVHRVAGVVIGVRLMKRVMQWGVCTAVLPG